MNYLSKTFQIKTNSRESDTVVFMQKYISKTLDSEWTWLKRLTVQAQVFEVAVGEVVLHDGHERGHLTEEQHFVVGGAELWQDAVQQLKLTGGTVQIKSTKSRYSTH